MVDNLLQIRDSEDTLISKNSLFIYRSDTTLREQLLGENESMITKLLAWITRAQLGSYLFTILGWVLCVTASSTEHWRIWHVESKDGRIPGMMWIGIWKACYLHSTHPENGYIHCEELAEDLKMMPKEIILAQDLMTLTCIVGALVICFMTFVLWRVVKTIRQKTFVLGLFNIGGLLGFLSGILILIPVFWNMYSILANRDIPFPESFNMPTVPKHQKVGAAIYVGYSAAVLFLASGVMIICNKNSLQKHAKNQVLYPRDESLTTQLSSTFGTSLIINVQNREAPDPSDDELTSVQYVDTSQGSSQSVQPQLLDDAKKVPIISVTPFR